MKLWIEDLLNLFYPAQCHICGNTLSPGERFICQPCIDTLPRTGYHRDKNNPMVDRFAGQFKFDTATGHFFYSRQSSLSQLIQDMKYRGMPSIGIKLGEIAGKELFMTGFFNDVDYIVPLPMHFIKKARRGYNQTDYITKGISNVTGIPVLNVLRMTRIRKTQTSLSQSERMLNAGTLFKVKRSYNLNNKGILLVDDICTTGTTMGSAAKVLANAFPEMKMKLFALGVTF